MQKYVSVEQDNFDEYLEEEDDSLIEDVDGEQIFSI